MSACAPRRREGGVAAIIYGIGEELASRGHSISYSFLEDFYDASAGLGRFHEVVFAHRLSRYISEHRGDFSIVNIHAPAGFLYGLRRKWFGRKDFPPYVMTLHGLEERRVHVQSREAKKGRAWNFALRNRLWHRFYTFPLYRGAIRTADGAHAYSRDVWNLLLLKYNLDSDRTAYIPNGADSRFYLPRTYDSV